jgi:hypothetical protein
MLVLKEDLEVLSSWSSEKVWKYPKALLFVDVLALTYGEKTLTVIEQDAHDESLKAVVADEFVVEEILRDAFDSEEVANDSDNRPVNRRLNEAVPFIIEFVCKFTDQIWHLAHCEIDVLLAIVNNVVDCPEELWVEIIRLCFDFFHRAAQSLADPQLDKHRGILSFTKHEVVQCPQTLLSYWGSKEVH